MTRQFEMPFFATLNPIDVKKSGISKQTLWDVKKKIICS